MSNALGSRTTVLLHLVRTVAITALFAWSVVGVSSSETTLFGPVTYVRETGQPVTLTNAFRVAGPLSGGTLRVWNYGVSSAVISVNDTEVLHPNDLNGNQPSGFLLERPLTLPAGSHTITVELRGKPGSWLVVDFVGAYAPMVSDLVPAQLTVAAGGGTGTLTVSVKNPDSVNAMHVALASSDPTAVSVPADVIVGPGSTSAAFSVIGGLPGGPIAITATLN